MMRWIFLLVLLIGKVGAAADMTSAKTKANDFIHSVDPFVPSSQVDLQQTVPAYTTSDVPQTSLINSNMYDEAVKAQQHSDAAKLIKESHDTRPEFVLDKGTSPIFSKTSAIVNDPQAMIDSLTGRYEDCVQEGGEALTQTSMLTCDEYSQLSHQACTVGQVVHVDAKHHYQCIKERNTENKSCDKRLTLTCISEGECASGGVVLNSIAADMAWNYSQGILTIGAIADNIWTGYCSMYERVTTFSLNNIDTIETFELTRVGYDDFMLITLNGHQVFLGPFAGTQLEITEDGQLVDLGTNVRPCELGISWVQQVNIDLKPYIVEGLNTLTMKVEVAGAGEGWVQIQTKQSCCSQWQEVWSNGCAEYES